MAEPSTVNCGLVVPNTGDLVGTWGSAALNPDYVAIDGYLGGVQTISASSSPIVLTSPAGFTPTPGGGPTQAQNAVLKFTGTLSTNVVVTLPLPGMHIIHNLTQGTGSLIFSAPGAGLSISTQPGSIQRIYNDGTNVYFVDLPAIGSFLDLCTTTVPAWINACTVAPYLYCNGASFNGTTYPYLVGIVGGTTLPDLRGRSRAFFNDGTSRITSAGSGINGDALLSAGGSQSVSIGATNLPASGVSVSVSGNISVISNVGGIPFNGGPVTASAGPGFTGVQLGSLGQITSTGSNSMTGSTANLGSGTALASMNPATISGITLIRAG